MLENAWYQYPLPNSYQFFSFISVTQCPDGTGCDICPGGTIEDNSEVVTIVRPDLNVEESATCGEWFSVACGLGLVEDDTVCTSFQGLLTDCCAQTPTRIGIAPTESPTSNFMNGGDGGTLSSSEAPTGVSSETPSVVLSQVPTDISSEVPTETPVEGVAV